MNNQRRLLNGSVDFNKTDTLANRYLREIQQSSIARDAGGSVSPSHNNHFGANMMIEGFTERAFDNLNQTVQFTLGQTYQLLNTSNPMIGGQRQQLSKRTLAEASKKRDVNAKSSIESHRQYSSPIPNDRAHIMPSQIEKMSQKFEKGMLQNSKIPNYQTQQVIPNPVGRGQKLKIKVAREKRVSNVEEQDGTILTSINSGDLHNMNQMSNQQITVSLPQRLNIVSKQKMIGIKNQVQNLNAFSTVKQSQEGALDQRLQNLEYPSLNLSSVTASQNYSIPIQSQDQKNIKIIDSSRVKIKPAGATNVSKNIKISPYQINWNPATKQQIVPASKQPSVMRASTASIGQPQSSRQQQQSIPMMNYGMTENEVYSSSSNYENPVLSNSPVVPSSHATSSKAFNLKTRGFGKVLLSDRQPNAKVGQVVGGQTNILVRNSFSGGADNCRVNNWIESNPN